MSALGRKQTLTAQICALKRREGVPKSCRNAANACRSLPERDDDVAVGVELGRPHPKKVRSTF
jgi:hypothetical protein